MKVKVVVHSDPDATPEQKNELFGRIVEAALADINFDIKARHRFENEGGYTPKNVGMYYHLQPLNEVFAQMSPVEFRRLWEGDFLPPIGKPPKEPK